MKFDYIIYNPPYSIGDKAVEVALDMCDEASVLMPFSKFKNLRENVKSIELVSNDGFDAAITNNCIAVLDHDRHNNCSIMEPFVWEFIEENNKFKTPEWLRYARASDKVKLCELDIDRDIIVPKRVCEAGGFGKTEKAVDYIFNINRAVAKEYYACAVIKCPSSKIKDNLAHFLHFDEDFRKRVRGAHASDQNKILLDLIPKNMFT